MAITFVRAKNVFVRVAVVSCLVLTLSCDRKSSVADGDRVVIGAILPLTGTGAVWGENSRKGMELARKEVNATGGINGKKLEIVYEDTQGFPQVAVSAIKKLISVDKVQVVLGCATSSATLAAAPIAKRNHVVLFSPGASSPKLSDAGPYFFRNFPSDAIEAPEIARMVFKKLNVKMVAILYVNNEFGKGQEQAFRQEFEHLGGKVVATEAFAQEASDFRTQITKIKDSNHEAIFLPGYPREMSTVLRQLAESGIKVPIVCPSAVVDDKLLQISGKVVEGVIFADQRPADTNIPSVSHFLRSYRETYHEEPRILTDTSYDAVKLVAKCITEAGNSGPAIQDALASTKDYPGAIGLTTFNEHGEIVKTPVFKKVENGKIVLFWDNSPAN